MAGSIAGTEGSDGRSRTAQRQALRIAAVTRPLDSWLSTYRPVEDRPSDYPYVGRAWRLDGPRPPRFIRRGYRP